MTTLRIGVVLLASALAACAIPAAPGIDERTLFDAQVDQGRRLAGEALRVRSRLVDLDLALTVASREFCGALTLSKLGGMFGSSASFTGSASRAVVEESYRLSKEPTVVHVTANGPLAAADVQPGDRLLELNGAAVDSIAAIGELMAARPQRVELTIGRAERTLRRTVTPLAACPVTLDYAISPALVTWKAATLSGGVPLGLMNLLDDDDELAVILGHQIAHLLFDRAEDDLLARERRADRIGLFVAARAGFEVARAELAWEKLAFEYPWLIVPPPRGSVFRSYPHGSLAQRMDGIRGAVREIADLKAAGKALVPSLP
jgi:hypothetical protein